jgi:hypothetical protein
MEKPLVNKKYLLEKFPRKGGWTYVIIAEISKEQRARFGWVKVKGTIDDYQIKNYRLMPMSNGNMFLPIKADIRKKIGKQKGDHVHIIFYTDNDPTDIPQELLLCLLDNPEAHKTFTTYTDAQRKEIIDWIYSAKRDETRVNRIAKILNHLEKGLKFREN